MKYYPLASFPPQEVFKKQIPNLKTFHYKTMVHTIVLRQLGKIGLLSVGLG